MPLNTHKYTRDGVTIVWQPDKCIHSGICANGLPQVFNPRRKPWIDMSFAEIEAIKKQVALCPSGALSILDESAKT